MPTILRGVPGSPVPVGIPLGAVIKPNGGVGFIANAAGTQLSAYPILRNQTQQPIVGINTSVSPASSGNTVCGRQIDGSVQVNGLGGIPIVPNTVNSQQLLGSNVGTYPTYSGAVTMAALLVSALSTTITATVTLNNVPQDLSVNQVMWYYRTHGTSTWTQATPTTLSGMPNPLQSQTLTYAYGQLENGTAYDFAAAFVSVRGDIGAVNAFQTNYSSAIVAIPSGNMAQGTTYTPTFSGISVSKSVAFTTLTENYLLGVTITNQPTDGSASRVQFYYRITGTTPWSSGPNVKAVGVGNLTPPSSGAYSITFTSMLNGVGYDFALSVENAAGGETAITSVTSISSTGLTVPKTAGPAMPGGATVSASSITIATMDSGLPTATYGGSGTAYAGNSPTLYAEFVLGDTNTPNSLTWGYQYILLTRLHSTSIPASTYSSYVATPYIDILATTPFGPGAQVYLRTGAVTPGTSYDIAFCIMDSQQNITNIVTLYSNYVVPKVQLGTKIGPVIMLSNMLGDTSGSTANLSDGTQLVHTAMSAAVQGVIASTTTLNVNPSGGVTSSLPYANHNTAIRTIINSDATANFANPNLALNSSFTTASPSDATRPSYWTPNQFPAGGGVMSHTLNATNPGVGGSSVKFICTTASVGGGYVNIAYKATDGASSFTYKANMTYVVSLYANVTANYVMSISGASGLSFALLTNYPNSHSTTGWFRYAWVMTVGNADVTSATPFTIAVTPTGNWLTSDIVYFAAPKVEEGSILTQWAGPSSGSPTNIDIGVATQGVLNNDGTANISNDNLLPNPDFSLSQTTRPTFWSFYSNGPSTFTTAIGSATPGFGNASLKATCTATGGGVFEIYCNPSVDGLQNIVLKAGQSYVFSIYAEFPAHSSTASFAGITGVTITTMPNYPITYSDGAWHRYAWLLVVGAADVTLSASTTYLIVQCDPSAGFTNGDIVYFAAPKLESGNVLTAWNAAISNSLVSNVINTSGTVTTPNCIPVSSALNSQASLLNIRGLNGYTYSNTSTTITISCPGITLTFTDGSTASVAAANFPRTGLSASSTYYFCLYIKQVSGVWTYGILFSLAASTQYTAAAAFPYQYQDGVIPMFFNASAVTPASGTGGGGGGSSPPANPNSCPAVWQVIETKERGYIRSDAVCVGEHIRKFDRTWAKVYRVEILAADIWRYTLRNVDHSQESFDVNDTHLVKTIYDTWMPVCDLKGGEKLKGRRGHLTLVKSHFIVNDFYVAFGVEGEEFSLGDGCCHNIFTGT